MQLYSCAVRPTVSAITLTTFTRKELIANTFLTDEAIDQILKNQRTSQLLKKWSETQRKKIYDCSCLGDMDKILEGDNAD